MRQNALDYALAVRLILELEQRADLAAAEAAAAGRIDAIAVPRGQRDPLREGDRQVGADASEAAVGQAMVREVVDPRVVGQELEVDAILTGPDRKPVGEVHQAEAARRVVVAVVYDVRRVHTDLGLERQDAGDLRATQVVGKRRFGRVAGERFLSVQTAVPELDVAGGGEEAAAEPEAEGAVRGGPVITDQLPC